MGFIDNLIDLIKDAIRWITNLIKKVIDGFFNFIANCVNWFKSLRLDKNRHVPFIAKGNEFKDMLKVAPQKNVGIFEGVYDEVEDEIVSSQFIEADGLDAKTREILNNEPLVVLS